LGSLPPPFLVFLPFVLFFAAITEQRILFNLETKEISSLLFVGWGAHNQVLELVRPSSCVTTCRGDSKKKVRVSKAQYNSSLPSSSSFLFFVVLGLNSGPTS
jgi:hypothetical protein